MKKIKILYFLAVMVAVYSCQKEVKKNNLDSEIDHGGFDPSERSVIIEFDQPIDGSYLDYNEELIIKGTIYANFNIHGYSLSIYQHDDLLWEQNNHIHGNHFEFLYKWINNLEYESAIQIKMTVVGNHLGNLDFFEELLVFAYGKN